MKGIIHLALSTCLFFGVACAHAVTYTVTSDAYSTGVGNVVGTFSGAMSTTGQVILDDSLPANLNTWTDISSYVTSYSFNDGVNTFTQANSTLARAEGITDGNGEITNLVLEFLTPAPPHQINDLLDALSFEINTYTPDTGSLSAVDDVSCTAVVNNGCDEGNNPVGSANFDSEENGSIRITMSSSPTAPQPPGTPSSAEAIPTMSTYGLILTTLGLLLVATRRLRVSAKRR